MKRSVQFVVLGLVFVLPAAAQEVAYLSLMGVQPRIKLRAPAPPPPICDESGCSISGGLAGASIGCGAGSPDDPRGLKTTLMFLDRLSYTAGDQVEMEIKIENVGSVDMEIPWSPHLPDLQPPDETLSFRFSSLQVELVLQNSGTQLAAFPVAQLYGNAEHAGTLLVLAPGESARLRLQTSLPGSIEGLQESRGSAHVSSGLRLERIIPNTKYGGYSTDIVNQYPRQLSGAPMGLEIHNP